MNTALNVKKVICVLSASIGIFTSSLLFADASSGVSATLATIAKANDDCMNQAESNVDMNNCAAQEFKSADQALNHYYQQSVARLQKAATSEAAQNQDPFTGSAEILKRLVASERAWVQFRDLNCKFEGTEMLGGTGEGLVVEGCLAQSTLDRLKELDSVLDSSN